MIPNVVYIIDDDEIYQFTLKKTLEINKLTEKLLVFSDGEKGIDFIKANLENKEILPDIIFLDINMPVMGGFQFMEEYLKIKPRIDKKIIIYMISSSIDIADKNRANNIADISDFLIKPIKTNELKGLLEIK